MKRNSTSAIAEDRAEMSIHVARALPLSGQRSPRKRDVCCRRSLARQKSGLKYSGAAARNSVFTFSELELDSSASNRAAK